MNGIQSAQTQDAVTASTVTASQPVGEGLSGLFQRLRAESRGDQHGGEPVRDAHLDGVASEHSEELGLLKTEAFAGGGQPAVNETSANGDTQNRGYDTHAAPPDPRSVVKNIDSVNVSRLRDSVVAWQTWCDAKAAALELSHEPHSLAALSTTCDVADACDTAFHEAMLEATYPDDESLFEQRGGEALARWRRYRGARPALSEDELVALRRNLELAFPLGADAGSHVQVLVDRTHVFPGGNAAIFAREYVRSLPAGWNESIVVSLRSGEPVAVCRWTEQRIRLEATRQWVRSLPSRLPDGRARFEALEVYSFDRAERVMFPTATPAPSRVTIETMSAPLYVATSEPGCIDPTGIAPLDAVLATGGIPRGARVVVQAATAQAKTLLSLEVADQLAARGKRVIWYATPDEPRESIQARRRQRLGVPRIDALNSLDDTGLDNAGLFVVDGRQWAIEDVLGCEGVDVLVLDPVSKVRTRAPVSDPVTRVGHVLDLVEASGWTVWMTAPVVRGAGRRTQTERALGGARIEAGATLLLELNRSGAELAIHVVKSRLGGEGREVNVRLDTERQRIVVPEGGTPVGSIEDRIWRDLQSALVAKGPSSRRALETSVPGKSVQIRKVVQAKLAAGQLVQLEKKVSLA